MFNFWPAPIPRGVLPPGPGIGGAGGGSGVTLAAFSLLTDAAQTAGLTGGNASTYIRLGIEAQGFVDVVTGYQYILGIDVQAGSIATKTLIYTGYSAYKDDHNPACPWLMPDGTTVMVLVTAHNVEALVKMWRSTTGDLADLVALADHVTPDLATYPTPLPHPGDGRAIFATRNDQLDWCLHFTTNNGLTFTNGANPVWTHSTQTYCRFIKIGTNEYLCHAAANPTVGEPAIYSFRVNTLTGAIRNAAGTTIANFITGLPFASASEFNADLFYQAPAGYSCSVGEAFADGSLWYFTQGTDDGQFDEWWTSRCTTANVWDPADYVHAKLCDAGYGVGSTTSTRWSSTARAKEIKFPGVTRRMLAISQLLRGTNYAFIMEEQDDFTWKNVLFVNEAPQATDHSEYVQVPLGNGQGKVLFAINPQDHPNYDAITNATLEFVRIDSIGTTAPVITPSKATHSLNEYMDGIVELTADQPCGFNIVGGDDAANFVIIGGKYLKLIHAANYDAPHDDDGDGVFDVQITARGFGNNLESDPFPIAWTIQPLVKTGMVQLHTQTADLTNAAWVINVSGTPSLTRSANSGDFFDQYGTNLLDKLIDATNNTSHNISQTKTLSSNTEYTHCYVWHPSTGAPFLSIRSTFGAAGNIVPTFDGRRGELVNVAIVGAVTLVATFCIPLANGCFLVGITFITPPSTASGQFGPAVRRFSGPSTTEVGVTSAISYLHEPSLNTGKFKTHVPRAA
jgi:hypothetical protein